MQPETQTKISRWWFVAIAVLIFIIVASNVFYNDYKVKRLVEYCEKNLSMTYYGYEPPFLYCAEYPNRIPWNGTPLRILSIRVG